MSTVPRIELGTTGATIARMLVGGWQLARGHRPGSVDEEALFGAFDAMTRAGLTSFDCADIYTGVEELLGRYMARRSASAPPLQVHTKYVPDRDALRELQRADVVAAVDRSLERLGREELDLVQFAWWDYDVPGCVEAAGWLQEEKRAGKIREVAATNFDVAHVRAMLDAGVELVAQQVQYSLLDRRPERGMTCLAGERDFGLLCYGSLAGGFLSSRWLGVAEEEVQLSNRSLVKYRLMIDEFGGWAAFQELLRVLAGIGERHGVPLSAVALRWVLDRPAVSGVIVGTYDGRHLEANLAAFDFDLDAGDRAAIDAVLSDHPGPAGDVWDLEREPDGPHARIMRTNLNRGAE